MTSLKQCVIQLFYLVHKPKTSFVKSQVFLSCKYKSNHVYKEIINTSLYHQRCIRSSMLHYIINATLRQCYMMPSTLHYVINTTLYHQHCIISKMLHCIINPALYQHCCITSPTLHLIINAALYHQRCILASMLHCIINGFNNSPNRKVLLVI